MLFCSINQQVINSISVTNRALNYGDGVFTTARISKGEIELCQQHFERLITACNALYIKGFDAKHYQQYCQQLALQYPNAVLKIVVTAGSGGRGYSRVGIKQPQVIVTIYDMPAHYLHWQQQGISLGLAAFKLSINPQLAGLKHLNRLEQVLIRHELDHKDYDDLLVTDHNGNIIEASCANVFWLKDNQLYTPKINTAGVNGLIRQQLLTKYENCQQVMAKPEQLADCDAIFLTNCIMGIVPVARWQNRLMDKQYFSWLNYDKN